MTLEHFDIRIQNELYQFIQEHKQDNVDESLAFWLEAFIAHLDSIDLDDGT